MNSTPRSDSEQARPYDADDPPRFGEWVNVACASASRRSQTRIAPVVTSFAGIVIALIFIGYALQAHVGPRSRPPADPKRPPTSGPPNATDGKGAPAGSPRWDATSSQILHVDWNEHKRKKRHPKARAAVPRNMSPAKERRKSAGLRALGSKMVAAKNRLLKCRNPQRGKRDREKYVPVVKKNVVGSVSSTSAVTAPPQDPAPPPGKPAGNAGSPGIDSASPGAGMR